VAAIAGVLLALVMASGVFLAESQMRLSRRGPAPAPWPAEEVQITADDGVILRGWYRAAAPGGSAVLLLHGIQDNRSGMTGVADMFLRHGYRVLLPDLRGHGASGGLVIYGVREAGDIQRWAEWLRARGLQDCLYGYGVSLGAAELLESLRAAPGFCAVVAEAPFSDFREAAYDRLSRTGISKALWLLSLDAALLYTRLRFGLDLAAISPRLALTRSRTPVLLFHGTEDVNLRIEHSRRTHAASPATTHLWEVPGADHFDIRLGAEFAADHAFLSAMLISVAGLEVDGNAPDLQALYDLAPAEPAGRDHRRDEGRAGPE
jgi:hypothetical protein